ncbi:MAG: glycosyltransferase [Acetobacteraceae bacterium]
MNAPPILVCVPAFRGAEVIGETLRAIARQQVPGLVCHISVDGGDAGTAEACRPFLADPRFRLTVQDRRLGWAGNLNALWAEARDGYAMYWQQDDLADDRYLDRLLAAAEAAPWASVTYADVQWFGARSEREELPSVTGFALDRAVRMAEAQHYLPFRGLVRAGALRAAGLLRITPFDSALEDLVQVARFARVGEMLRVPGPIYLKRAHRAAVHGEHLRKPAAIRRGAARLYAAGMLAAAWPAAHGTDGPRVARRLLPRWLRAAPGRWLHYDPAAENAADAPRFACEVLREAAAACGVPSGVALLGPWAFDEADPDQALLAEALRREAWRGAFRARVARDGGGSVSAGEADALLSSGWSLPEAWGVWTDGPDAMLDLPLPEGRWRVELDVRAFPPAARPRVTVTQDGALLAEARLAAQDGLAFVAEAGADGARIALALPDATSPAALGLGDDARALSLGLVSVGVARG